MKPLIIFTLTFLLLTAFSNASLRLRYTDCTYRGNLQDCHTIVGQYLNPDNVLTHDIWSGFDPQNGFDNASISETGELKEGVESLWIDSIFEPIYEDAYPFLRNNILEPRSRYAAWLAGALHITEAGEYQIRVEHNHSNRFVLWVDKDGNGEINFNTEHINAVLKDGHWQPSSGYETITLQFSKTGIYKIMASYFDRRHLAGNVKVSWKKPGATEFEVIPASAFGKRKQYGHPVAAITNIQLRGRNHLPNGWPPLPTIEECEPIVFEAEADNMLGKQPVYVWEFGNEVPMKLWGRPDLWQVECNSPKLTYYYSCPGCKHFFPYIRVRRGDDISPVNRKPKLQININDNPEIDICPQEPVCGG